MFSKFPKLLRFQIALCLDPCYIFLLARKNIEFQKIISNDYFWQLKLFSDYPQFKHSKPYNLEHYKRMYKGKAEIFVFTTEDTKDVEFTKEEYSYVSDENLKVLTEMVKDSDYIRGDLFEVEAFQNIFQSTYVIFDGKELINVIYDKNIIIPKQFKILDEFPLTYWSELGRFTPFYIDKSLLHIDEKRILCQPRTDRSFGFNTLYTPLVINDHTYYAIYNQMNVDIGHLPSFVEALKKVEYIVVGEVPDQLPFRVDNSFIIVERGS